MDFWLFLPLLSILIIFHTSKKNKSDMMEVTSSANTLARVGGPAWAGILFSLLGMD